MKVKFIIAALLVATSVISCSNSKSPVVNDEVSKPESVPEVVESLQDVVLWTMDQPKCQGMKSSQPSEPERIVRARQIDRILNQIGGPRHIQESFIALMCKESQYRICLKSPAGALGVAQLMPATAQAEADKAGWGKLDADDLCDPEINIFLGYQHFKGLADLYKGNVARAFAGYNGGTRGATVTSMVKGGGRGVHETDDYVAQLFDMQEQRRIAREEKTSNGM